MKSKPLLAALEQASVGQFHGVDAESQAIQRRLRLHLPDAGGVTGHHDAELLDA